MEARMRIPAAPPRWRLWVSLLIGWAVGGGIACLVWVIVDLPFWWFFVLLLLLSVAVFPFIARYYGYDRDYQTLLTRLRHDLLRVCIYCRQPLRHLEPNGICPQCGRIYNIDDVVKSWACWCSANNEYLLAMLGDSRQEKEPPVVGTGAG